MINLTVDCLKFGGMVVRSAPYDAFEVLRLNSDNTALSVARIEVEKTEVPQLRVSQGHAAERCVDSTSMASIERVVLGKWSDEVSTEFELTVEGSPDRIQFVLHGHRDYHAFRWGVEFQLLDGDVTVRGPAFLDDPLS